MVEFPSRNDEPERAQADWLMAEESGKPSSPSSASAPPSVTSDESYDILGADSDDHVEGSAAVVPPIPPPKPKKPVKPPSSAAATESAPRERRSRPRHGTVDEVWTRWAEWGPDVIRVGVVAALLLIPLYYSLMAMQFFVAFLILAGGGILLAILGYPLFITMERPVRITPEQALKDYYAALSHPKPHIRRMWLLLSSAGRSSPSFSSFDEFKTYWNNTLDTLKMGKASRFNPFVFTVRDFKAEKSAGLTELEAKFTLNVRPRAEESAPGQNYPVVMGLVKGPDKMWYLDEGTMPRG